MMTRDLLELGRTGTKSFGTTPTLADQRIGIIGLGRIGSKVASDLKALGVRNVRYFSRTRKPDVEQQLGIKYVELDELLQTSDIASIHVSKDVGARFLGAEQLKLVKDGGLIVNLGYPESVDVEALLGELSSGRLRAAYDDLDDERFRALPLHNFFCTNGSSAFNTNDAIKRTSNSATSSIINLLTSGDDKFLANPDYRNHRQQFERSAARVFSTANAELGCRGRSRPALVTAHNAQSTARNLQSDARIFQTLSVLRLFLKESWVA